MAYHPGAQAPLPSRLILPCQPVLARDVPNGFRIIARREYDLIRLWSRNALNWADTFLRIRAALERLPAEKVIIDGEAVLLTAEGRSDFHRLRTNTAQDAQLVAFDLLALDGRDLRQQPLWARRKRLADLLKQAPDDGLLFSGHVESADGQALFRHACAMNLEGIVSQRIASPYRSGRYDGWRKIKCSDYQRP